MNLRRVTFPPSRSSHARPGNRPHPPVGGKEWRDETPPVGVTAISVEKQEAGFPPLSPGEGFDRRSRHLARSPFGRYGERGSKPPRTFIESRTVGRSAQRFGLCGGQRSEEHTTELRSLMRLSL